MRIKIIIINFSTFIYIIHRFTNWNVILTLSQIISFMLITAKIVILISFKKKNRRDIRSYLISECNVFHERTTIQVNVKI